MKNTNVRKTISMLITVMLMLSMISSAFVTAGAEAFRKGDVDGDDVIGMSDVVLLQRAIASLVELTEQQAIAGDVTYDTEDKMEDVVEIQRYIAKLIPDFDAPPAEEKKIEVGSTVTVKAGSVNDANGTKMDALDRYLLYVVKEINGENAKIEARYLFNGHTSVMTYEVKLADLELSEKALDFGEVSTELKVGAAVTLTNVTAFHEKLLVYKVVSIGTEENAAVELEASYILKNGEYKVTKSVTAADVVLYTGTEPTWGIAGSDGEIAVGNFVVMNAGAKTYAGENIADFWFFGLYTVDSIEGDKAVISMKADKAALERLGLSTQLIADLVNANKDAILAMPTEDILEIAARFGIKINNIEKYNSLVEMLKTTTITAEMLDVALSTLNYSVRFEMNVADLANARLA